MVPWHKLLDEARDSARLGHFQLTEQLCSVINRSYASDFRSHLDSGELLLSCGLLTLASKCFRSAATLVPHDFRALGNQANVAQQRCDHSVARRIYEELLVVLPDVPAVRRNAISTLEYDGHATDLDRFLAAKAWGVQAEKWAGGGHRRPTPTCLNGRPLRVGYVSADFCQHTVGLFVKDVLAAHDSERIVSFAYSAGNVSDWVSDEIKSVSTFRDIHELDDRAFAERIRSDSIDVLVDLSGHTARSRLTVFAHRPAPVLVSWLGYFATTGLSCMDAVLLDAWHAPLDVDAFFTETVVRMPQGRLCYTPVPFAPNVAPPPHEVTGRITFGSFNNTSKLSTEVLKLWSRILLSVPDSRLVLKWRTFNDDAMRKKIIKVFEADGVEPDRIELRGPSFHADLLKEYGDIDIALDPFPFTGGLTSCEALWMGVPVVTWPQSRVVSRQTYAFLSQIGLTEWAARDADDYVNIAMRLANNRQRLSKLRATLRGRMAASPLCDIVGFTRGLEDTLCHLFDEVELLAQNGENTAAIYDHKETEQFAMTEGQKITIDGKDYALSEMSDAAKEQLNNLQVTDQEIQRLNTRIAIVQTARAAYAHALKAALDGAGPAAPQLKV